MARHTIFISDLHLSYTTKLITKLFEEFIERITPDTEAVFILGDLFKFWIGDDDNSDFNQEIKSLLKKSCAKTPIYLMPGNRDFLLGKRFAEETGATLITDPFVIDLYGRKTVLTHGDILCTDDPKYWLFRRMIRFPLGIKLFLMLPLSFRMWLATKIQKYSAKMKAKKDRGCLAVQENAVNELLKQFNARQLIHGHVHVQEIVDQRFSLGEWCNKPSILIYYNDHNYEFET
jgi:UDP-2,3-diacylglucosamine hydrolase